MRRCGALSLGLFLLLAAAPVAQEIRIDAANGSDLEKRGVEQLRRLLKTYDLERWIFTDAVRIESYVIPHSHPVLTVNTRYIDRDDLQVATFVHENFHWYVIERQQQLAAAIDEHRALFPDAPGRDGGGARDPNSTYLHLVVCDLEYRAMIDLFGAERARKTIESWDHYPWVYERVLADPRVHAVNARHGLIPPS